jgi:hypothetical protein
LVELTVTEQRYRAVLEVQAGVPVIEVAERFGVSGDRVIEVAHRLGGVAAEPAQLHRFGCPVL